MKSSLTISEIFHSINDLDTMQQFIDEIFTEAERKDLSLRWQLMKMLRAGVPQRRIASELGISLCKITRGAKIIKNKKSASNRMLDNFEQ